MHVLVPGWSVVCLYFRCKRHADEVALNDVEAVIASTPWQVRCHCLATAARAFQACVLHEGDSLSRDEKNVLYQAREWVLAGLRDSDARVRLSASHHLHIVLRCVCT
jgi:hypothetical protein